MKCKSLLHIKKRNTKDMKESILLKQDCRNLDDQPAIEKLLTEIFILKLCRLLSMGLEKNSEVGGRDFFEKKAEGCGEREMEEDVACDGLWRFLGVWIASLSEAWREV